MKPNYNELIENEKDKDLLERFLSTRSVLYNLEPVGIGTPYVESLSSYIARLAEKHGIKETILIKEVISPIIQNKNIKNEFSIRGTMDKIYRINGISAISFECIESMGKLIGRQDIQYTTMINWSGVFNKNVTCSHRRWCPLCLEKFREELGVVYEPLLWTISDIEICDIHQILLEECCPHCNKKLNYVHSNMRVGQCQYCSKWLGKVSTDKENVFSKDQIFIIENYKQLFEVAPRINSVPIRNLLANRLQSLKEGLGFDSMRAFSKYLDVDIKQMLYWSQNKWTPSPKNLLHISRKLDCTIYDILSGKDLNLKLDVNDSSRKEMTKSIGKAEMENYLRNAAYSANPPKSFNEVCKEGNISSSTAKNHFPELSKIIVENFQLYQKEATLKKKKNIENILNIILDQQTPRNLKESLNDFGLTVRIAQRYQPELCKKIVERNKKYVEKEKIRRIKFFEEELKNIIYVLHQEGIYPSMVQILKAISQKGIFLDNHFRTYRKEILKSLGYEVDE